MENNDIIGACGDNCSFCLRYKAAVNDNQDELARLKDLWVSLGWRGPNIEPIEMRCTGCSKENKCAYEKLRNCVFSKALKNCGMCSEYPCEITEEAFTRTKYLFTLINKSRYSPSNFSALEKAFANKKKNLDAVNDLLFKKVSTPNELSYQKVRKGNY